MGEALLRTHIISCATLGDEMKRVADFFGMAFEEIEGSDVFLRKLVEGDWDQPAAHANGDFVVIEPGQTVEYTAFSASGSGMPTTA